MSNTVQTAIEADDLDDAKTGGLTDKQAEFCRQFLIDLNVSAAGRRAGYADGSASGEIYRVAAKPAVQAELKRLMRERAERTMVSADRVVLELAAVAFSNVTDYEIGGDGRVTLVDGVDPLAHRAVASVKKRVRKGGKDEEVETEIKLWDKIGALKLLAQHLGMLDKKLTVAGDPEKPISVQAKWSGLSLTVEDLLAARELVEQMDERIPKADVVTHYLRDLGLPCPGDPPPTARP